ncbi:MAG: NAD-dependent deacylase [Asticcacaulis sp.]|uniref:NAD-dependent deacylase n=1 Tax=Asticcacaulis sp. TaxID=1872648 RepID=UPI0025C25872|nr:NAD-dependent deacylase [Asticcacaulis sp.]MCA1934448.1 NAD-dependent deacylase [Asticcacaulis sp.]
MRPSIVILTGSGISAESGVPTFRASDGLWCGHRVEAVATPEGFEANPVLVHDFYNQRRAQLKDVAPNAAHQALARLSAAYDGDVLLVTQNVDDLHDRAHRGVTPKRGFGLIHMHGEVLRARCIETGRTCDWTGDIHIDTPSPFGTLGLRPDIVWFGEMPFQMERIYDALSGCGLFISIGTSGNVYPAAGFVQEATRAGAHTVELNLEPSQGHSLFKERLYGPATEVVPAYVEGLVG